MLILLEHIKDNVDSINEDLAHGAAGAAIGGAGGYAVASIISLFSKEHDNWKRLVELEKKMQERASHGDHSARSKLPDISRQKKLARGRYQDVKRVAQAKGISAGVLLGGGAGLAFDGGVDASQPEPVGSSILSKAAADLSKDVHNIDGRNLAVKSVSGVINLGSQAALAMPDATLAASSAVVDVASKIGNTVVDGVRDLVNSSGGGASAIGDFAHDVSKNVHVHIPSHLAQAGHSISDFLHNVFGSDTPVQSGPLPAYLRRP